MKQLIYETKIKQLNSNTKLDSNSTQNSYLPLLSSHAIINDYTNLIYGTLDLNLNYQTYQPLGNALAEYAIIEIHSNSLFHLRFTLNNTVINLTTSAFSYKNNISKISNIFIANGTLVHLNENSFSELPSSKSILVNYLMLTDFNLVSVNEQELPYAYF